MPPIPPIPPPAAADDAEAEAEVEAGAPSSSLFSVGLVAGLPTGERPAASRSARSLLRARRAWSWRRAREGGMLRGGGIDGGGKEGAARFEVEVASAWSEVEGVGCWSDGSEDEGVLAAALGECCGEAEKTERAEREDGV